MNFKREWHEFWYYFGPWWLFLIKIMIALGAAIFVFFAVGKLK